MAIRWINSGESYHGVNNVGQEDVINRPLRDMLTDLASGKINSKVINTIIALESGITWEETVEHNDLVIYDDTINKYRKFDINTDSTRGLIGFADLTNDIVITSGIISDFTGLVEDTAYFASPTVAGDISSSTTALYVGNAFSSTVLYVNFSIASDVNITGQASKTTIVDADEMILADSANSFFLKKITWSNIKATLKTYFDTLYVNITSNQTVEGIKTFSSLKLGGAFNGDGNYIKDVWYNQLADVTVSTGTHTIYFSDGNRQKITAGGSFTLAFGGISANQNVFVIEAVNWGAYTITFPAGLKVEDGALPAFTASGTDLIAIEVDKNGTYTLSVIAQNIGVIV